MSAFQRQAITRLKCCILAVALLCSHPWDALNFCGWSKARHEVLRTASKALPGEPSKEFLAAVEEYHPGHPEDGCFEPGPPPRGFRNLTQSIQPYHANPEWMVWPDVGSFERDQKVASLYTLATGLFSTLNKCIHENNEDGMRRHAGFIWELRQMLRFRRSTICTPAGRRCRPFQGQLLRGLQIEDNAKLYKLVDAYRTGVEFRWPGFTTCQLEEAGLWPFDGNLNFEIACNVDPRDMQVEELYAPVKIGRFLHDSQEVLIPPQTKFRVTATRGPELVTEHGQEKEVFTVSLEVIELPAVWDGR